LPTTPPCAIIEPNRIGTVPFVPDARSFVLPPKQPDQPRTAERTFEEALGQLQAIVQELEEGKIGLNEAMARYEEGVKLLRQCYDLLQRAQRKIELLSGVDAEGNPITTPLDDTALSLDEKAESRGRRRSTSGRPSRPRGVEPEEGAEIDFPGGMS
jgi:exodeoxyribonuclease VII small subunit